MLHIDNKRVIHSSGIKKLTPSNAKMQVFEKRLCPNNARIMRKETSMPIEGKWHPMQCEIIWYILERYLLIYEEGGISWSPYSLLSKTFHYFFVNANLCLGRQGSV